MIGWRNLTSTKQVMLVEATIEANFSLFVFFAYIKGRTAMIGMII